MVERAGLENQSALTGTVGSNPTLSAITLDLFNMSMVLAIYGTTYPSPYPSHCYYPRGWQNSVLAVRQLIL